MEVAIFAQESPQGRTDALSKQEREMNESRFDRINTTGEKRTVAKSANSIVLTCPPTGHQIHV